MSLNGILRDGTIRRVYADGETFEAWHDGEKM